MKIVLINPNANIWIESKPLPLGLAYIASFVMSKGYKDVEIIDFNIYPDKKIPYADVYGITSTTPLIYSAFDIAREIKKINKNAYVVIGGPHPTCLPDESIRNYYIDIVVRGEGEYTFYEILQFLEGEKNISDIKGITYKDNGKIIHNEAREFIKNLDELPFPARELFGDLKKYTHPQPLIGWRKPVVNIITSRGCPYNCYFCYKGTFGRMWRARSAENVVAEWEYLIKKFNVKEICIQDDIFNLNINRAKKIMKLIIDRNLKLPFSFPNGIRADMIDEELVKLMKEAGLYRVALGVESGVQSVLDKIGKKLKLENVEKAIALFKKYKIQTIAFFVLGNPGDDEDTLKETIKYAKKLNPTFAQFSMATPFPGTRLYELAQKTNTLRIKRWDEYSQFDQKGYFDYENLKGETISKYVNKAYKEFYINIRFFIKMIFLKDFYKKIFYFIKGFLHFIIKGR